LLHLLLGLREPRRTRVPRDVEDDMRLKALAANSGDQLASQVLRADGVTVRQWGDESNRDRAR